MLARSLPYYWVIITYVSELPLLLSPYNCYLWSLLMYKKLKVLYSLLPHTHALTSFLSTLGAGDIGNGNLKLILGLVWKLILHYQILNIETPPRDDDPPEGLNRAVLAKDVLRGYVQVCR